MDNNTIAALFADIDDEMNSSLVIVSSFGAQFAIVCNGDTEKRHVVESLERECVNHLCITAKFAEMRTIPATQWLNAK